MEKIKWKNIELVNLRENIEETYIESIFNFYQDYDTRYMFTNNMYIYSYGEFYKKFHKQMIYKYHEFMLIKNINSNEIIGFIYSYNYSANDGTLYITEYVERQKRGGTYGIEACLVFLEYLFKRFSIRKIYCVAYEYNKISTKIMEEAGFTLEGKLIENKYLNNQYYDEYIYSLKRQEFYEIRNKLKK